MTWADIGAMLCFVVVAALIHAVASVILRRKTRPALQTSELHTVRHRVMGALGRPLYALIWVYGIYFIATPVLRRLNADQDLAEVRAVVDRLLDVGLFAALCWFLVRLTRVMQAHLELWAARSASRLDALFIPLLGKSLRILVPVLGIIFALPMLDLPSRFGAILAKASSILLIGALAAMLMQLIATSEKALLAHFDLTAANNLRARKVYTQVHVISKGLYVAVGFFTVATVLMLFPEVRHVGTSLLASAGIVGIIAGIAAKNHSTHAATSSIVISGNSVSPIISLSQPRATHAVPYDPTAAVASQTNSAAAGQSHKIRPYLARRAAAPETH